MLKQKTPLTFADAGVVNQKLVLVIVKHDQIMSHKPGYNTYALGLYCKAAVDTEARLLLKQDLRLALLHSFNGALLNKCLRACGLPKATKDEKCGIYPLLPVLND